MNLVITGFEPYGDYNLNSSWEVAKSISCEDFCDVNLKQCLLPVSFDKIGGEIERIIKNNKPEILILLGQSSKTDKIRLERIAINLKDSERKDNDGVCPTEEYIIEGEVTAFLNTLPLRKLKDHLCKKKLPVKISNTAGTFVCNAAYYYALYFRQLFFFNIDILFIHLPLVENTKPRNEAYRYLSLPLMKEVVIEVVKFLKEKIHE